MLSSSPYKFRALFNEGYTPVICWQLMPNGSVTGMVVWQGSVYLEAASNIPSFIRYEIDTTCPEDD